MSMPKVYENLVATDREQRGRIRRRVCAVELKGDKVRVVGSGPSVGGLRRSRRGRLPLGWVRVSDGWVNGRLTNHSVLWEYVRRQQLRFRSMSPKAFQWYERHRKGRESWVQDKSGRPGVVVSRSGGRGLREATRAGLPTVGRRSLGNGLERTYGLQLPEEEGRFRVARRTVSRRGHLGHGSNG